MGDSDIANVAGVQSQLCHIRKPAGRQRLDTLVADRIVSQIEVIEGHAAFVKGLDQRPDRRGRQVVVAQREGL